MTIAVELLKVISQDKPAGRQLQIGTYRVVRAYNHDAAYQERHINLFSVFHCDLDKILIYKVPDDSEHDFKSDRVGSLRTDSVVKL